MTLATGTGPWTTACRTSTTDSGDSEAVTNLGDTQKGAELDKREQARDKDVSLKNETDDTKDDSIHNKTTNTKAKHKDDKEPEEPGPTLYVHHRGPTQDGLHALDIIDSLTRYPEEAMDKGKVQGKVQNQLGFTDKYLEGKAMACDYASRHAVPIEGLDEVEKERLMVDNGEDIQVMRVFIADLPPALPLDVLREVAAQDEGYQRLMVAVKKGRKPRTGTWCHTWQTGGSWAPWRSGSARGRGPTSQRGGTRTTTRT